VAERKRYLHLAAHKVVTGLKRVHRNFIQSSFDALRSTDNKALRDIAMQFAGKFHGKSEGLGYLEARVQQSNKWMNRLATELAGYEKLTLSAALHALQNGTEAPEGKPREAQQKIRAMLDELYDYAQEGGLKFKKAENYFPRMWNTAAIVANPKKFADMLRADNPKLTEEDARGIVSSLVARRGGEALTEDEGRIGYTPFMQAANRRKLDFLKQDYSEFLRNDATEIMAAYIGQITNSVEYARRFGHDGRRLAKQFNQAYREEAERVLGEGLVDRITRVMSAEDIFDGKPGPSHNFERLINLVNDPAAHPKLAELVREEKGEHALDDLRNTMSDARRAIMAMEGTLNVAPGYNGSNAKTLLRRLTPALITYQNLHHLMLSLFSQLVDPLGVMVRGGTVRDAMGAYVEGLRAVFNGWRGKENQSDAWKLARQLGVVDTIIGTDSMASQYYGTLDFEGLPKKINDALFKWNGVENFTQGLRVAASQAAVRFIEHHLGKGDKMSERYLAELGLKKGDKMNLDDPKIRDAIYKWVDGAIARPNAAMRPTWANDPHYALFFHMKAFMYAIQRVTLSRAGAELKHGNFGPLATLGLGFVPVMIAADIMRGFVANGGDEPPWMRRMKGAGDYYWRGVERAGLYGVGQIGRDVLDYGPLELGGPTVEQAGRAVAHISGGRWNKVWRDALPSVPVIRKALS
jgi:hypothetical protein